MDTQEKPGLWARSRALVVDQIRQGTTPHQLALTLAIASAIALFPILGATTLLCLAAGALLRLNQPLMQLVNYLMSGLQLLLILPLWKAGAWIGAPPFSLSLDEVKSRFNATPWQSLRDFGGVILGGVGIWALAAPLWIALVYLVSRPLLRRIAARRRLSAESPPPA